MKEETDRTHSALPESCVEDDPGFHAIQPGGSYRIVNVITSFDPWPLCEAARSARGSPFEETYMRDVLNDALRDAVASDLVGDYLVRFRGGSDHGAKRLATVTLALHDSVFVEGDVKTEFQQIDAMLDRIFGPAVAGGAMRTYSQVGGSELNAGPRAAWDVVASDRPFEGEIFQPPRGLQEVMQPLCDRRSSANHLKHMVVVMLAGIDGDAAAATTMADVCQRLEQASRTAFGVSALVLQSEIDGVAVNLLAFEVAGDANVVDDEGTAVYNYVASAAHTPEGVLIGYQVGYVWQRYDAVDACELIQTLYSVARERAVRAKAEQSPEELVDLCLPARLRVEGTASAPVMGA